MKTLNKDMTIKDESKVIKCQSIHIGVYGCKLKRPDIRVQWDPLKQPGEGRCCCGRSSGGVELSYQIFIVNLKNSDSNR